ncbi:HAD family hydrolase [Aquimarina sp. W85]|uniref:HAD family hydrolase n=1 Tax=Aquimarina rhodophyticola TaxID=3342246 RepID=UPI00366F57BD
MIKTIIFDFGDVFINLDKNATNKYFKNLKSLQAATHLLSKNDTLFEIGQISTHTFLSTYQEFLNQKTTNLIIEGWNSILLDFPTYRFNFIKELYNKRKYQLILLSNTNSLHIEWIEQNISFYEDFKQCFDYFYLSHEIGVRKPDYEIYNFVLQNHKLDANEVLFIDDTKANIEAAKDLGIHTWHIDPTSQDIVDLFTTKSELF